MVIQRYIGFILTLMLSITAAIVVFADENNRSDDHIIFSHTLHVDELEISCLDCHASVTESLSSSDHNLPSMDNCGDCHDIDDSDNCGLCHTNVEEAEESTPVSRAINFNHRTHLGENLQCVFCHSDKNIEETVYTIIPSKPLCMECHNGVMASWDCTLCHEEKISLIDIHPVDWRKQHVDQATNNINWCAVCHGNENFCQDCHRGDNLIGSTHSLNYRLTHGLDVISKEIDCSACHDSRQFCNECHISELRLPWQHSTMDWLTNHGDAAKQDIENCASCHDEQDPTCARVGCHMDQDGIPGTDPAIHPGSITRFDREGSWHEDKSYFCYQCHTDANQTGIGFCGYCHD